VGIALPNGAFWVNLHPDSPNDIIDPLLAQTEVGRILLEADLQLKKDTANATNPGNPEGREYWDKLYQKAGELYGTQNVTIPTLTRPWIVPNEIIIRESTDSAYVYKATLKVMLEQDYLKGNTTYSFKDEREKQLNEYSAQIIRESILPRLTKEINSAKRYAPLRQVYYSLILAQWFKARNLNKNTQYSSRINKKDLTNLVAQTPYSVNTYFNAYRENFAKGEYNIKEPRSTPYGQVIRSYFSGGITGIAPLIPAPGAVSAGSVTVVPDSRRDIKVDAGLISAEDSGSEGLNLITVHGEQNSGQVGGIAEEEIERRKDLARRSAINRINTRINDYHAFDASINRIIIKLQAGEVLSSEDLLVLDDLRNRLILKNPLVAMHLKVHRGDIIVVNNQAAIKFLNSVISQPQVDRFIDLRQKVVTRLLLESGLIRPLDVNTLSLLFKQDKFVIEAAVVSSLGEKEVLRRLDLVAQKLTVELTQSLRDEFKDNETIQQYSFLFNFGVSASLAEDSDDARILADIQALQAAKIARRRGLAEFMFSQQEFDKLMLEADKLRQNLGLAPGELLSEDEMKAVRDKTEEDLEADIRRGVESAERQLLLKKYLDIIDLFDYLKPWRANPERRLAEMNASLGVLEGLTNIIMEKGPPGASVSAVNILQDALLAIKTNSKNHRITSGEAFLANSAELLEQKGGKLIAVDVIGFWAQIQANLARAHQEYMLRRGLDDAENEKLVLKLSLDADDLVKRSMAEKLEALTGILGGYIPIVEFSGKQLLLVNQEGGDEIVFYINGQYDWDVLASELSSRDLGVRIMTVGVSPGKASNQSSLFLGMVYTGITHGYFGEVYITTQQMDNKVKDLEKLGVVSAVVSLEVNDQNQPEWFVYHQGRKKVLYNSFYQEAVQGQASTSGNKGGIDFSSLPIVTMSLDNLKASIGTMFQNSLQRINLTQEWSDIERLVNSGITPSSERLKKYLAASCFKGDLDRDMEKIVSCISDILRMQEQTCSATDPVLKDILVVLGSGRSGEELKISFSS
jgi:hypothetical protein